MNTDMQFVERIPTTNEYTVLRNSAGWHPVESEYIKTGLENSLYAVCVFQGKTLIGMGRIVGDGGIYYYVQDLIVLPEFQKKGIGIRIMNSLMKFIYRSAPSGAFVGLMAAKGKKGFYQKFGFEQRPAEGPGMFMVMSSHGVRREEP